MVIETAATCECVCTLCLNGIDSVYLVDHQGLGYELRYKRQETKTATNNKDEYLCVCRLCLNLIDQGLALFDISI